MFKKKCNTCGKTHTDPEDLHPLGDSKVIEGMLWFNCPCGSTLCVRVEMIVQQIKQQLIKDHPWLKEVFSEMYEDIVPPELEIDLTVSHEVLYWTVLWNALPYDLIEPVKELYEQLGGVRV